MDKFKKYIPRIVLLDTILFAAVIIILDLILSFFKLMFRERIVIGAAVIIMAGLVIGIVQLLLKIKKKVVKGILISIFAALLVLSAPMIYLFAVFAYASEHVVERDGEKLVAYVNGFQRTYVNYYEYKNIFVVGNQKRIQEDYCRGGFDPIENKYGYQYDAGKTIYYYENGEIIKTEP